MNCALIWLFETSEYLCLFMITTKTVTIA